MSLGRGKDSVVGKHVFGDLYGIDEKIGYDEKLLRDAVVKAAEIANMTLYDVKSWRFGGKKGGVSVIALVLESHIAVHTWPKYRYATIDVYTCGAQSDPVKAFEYLVDVLRPEQYTMKTANRSQDKETYPFP